MHNEISMKTTVEAGVPSVLSTLLPARERMLYYTNSVTQPHNDKVLKAMGKMLDQSAGPIGLFITSPGGASGTAMSFHDTVKHVLRPDLVTIGSGDVDSSGVIIFLTGGRRYVTARTTMLLHPAGRIFGSQRYTTHEMAAMLAEDRLKDIQYASVLAHSSNGRLTIPQVLTMMKRHTVLSPVDMVAYGLADAILP